MSTRILLLGGSGLIGSAIQQTLISKYPSTLLLNLDKSQINFADKSSAILLRSLLKEYSPTHIIILAAVKRQDNDSNKVFEDNEKITKHISESISDVDAHITYISSCAVYGEKNQQRNYNEKSLIRPTSLYGHHKASSEAAYMSAGYNSRLLIIRPPLIYGDTTVGYNPSGFLIHALEHKPIILWGDGLEKREFLYVYDAVSNILDLVQYGKTGVYNLVSGTSWSYRYIADTIMSYLPSQTITRHRSADKVDHTYDNSFLRSALNDPIFICPKQFIRRQIEKKL